MKFIEALGQTIVAIFCRFMELFILLPLFAVVGALGGAFVGFFHALTLWGWNVFHRKPGDWAMFYSEIEKEPK